MFILPEKSKRKGKSDRPYSPQEKQSIRFIIALTITGIVMMMAAISVSAYLSERYDPFNLTSTAISRTNDFGCLIFTITPAWDGDIPLTPRSGCYSHYEIQWLTGTAAVAHRQEHSCNYSTVCSKHTATATREAP